MITNMLIADTAWVEEVITKIENKMKAVRERSCNKIPATTINGQHDDRSDLTKKWSVDNGINWWTNGFWGGMMWMLYQDTKDERYAQIAEISEKKLDQCFTDFYGLHHDVGFMWMPTAVMNYKLTGNQDARRRAMHAANLLAGRFNPAGRFIRAWNDSEDEKTDTRGWAIIDCMFNISLLYWASEETGDPRFRQIAVMHADTVQKYFIRADGSVIHIGVFDPETGEFIKSLGGQGYGEGSSWTRGQSWALYGYMISYIHTGKKEYLDTAKRVAHYFMANIPESGLIPVDFRQPKEPAWEDSIAAAVAACGLIEIAKAVDQSEKELYLTAAMKLLKTLYEKRCDWDEASDGILQNCTSAYHDAEHHKNLTYGDAFFIEAVMKLKGEDIFLW